MHHPLLVQYRLRKPTHMLAQDIGTDRHMGNLDKQKRRARRHQNPQKQPKDAGIHSNKISNTGLGISVLAKNRGRSRIARAGNCVAGRCVERWAYARAQTLFEGFTQLCRNPVQIRVEASGQPPIGDEGLAHLQPELVLSCRQTQ